MAKGTLGQVVQRAISDAAFRNRLRTDPGGALSGFDLTPAERAAIQSGDAAKLASFGVDQRMSKTFAMGEAASGASRLVGTDLQVGATIDGGTPLGTNAILEEGFVSARSAVDDTSGSAQSAIRDGDGPFLAGSVDDTASASGGTSAFLTADEMGNDTTGVAGSAASESDAVDDTSMANPATYDQAHPTESELAAVPLREGGLPVGEAAFCCQ